MSKEEQRIEAQTTARQRRDNLRAVAWIKQRARRLDLCVWNRDQHGRITSLTEDAVFWGIIAAAALGAALEVAGRLVGAAR